MLVKKANKKVALLKLWLWLCVYIKKRFGESHTKINKQLEDLLLEDSEALTEANLVFSSWDNLYSWL